jgi:hypothetical protein
MRSSVARCAGSRRYGARRLDDLRTWRNLCDYEDTVRNVSLILRSAVAAARDVVEALV